MNIWRRLKALEEKVEILDKLTKSSCRMKDGEERLFLGFDVLLPFLEGELTHVTTNNRELADLMRGMDPDEDVKIELMEP